MLGYKEKVPGIASHSNRQRLGRREPVVPPCVWRDAHRMIAALSPSRVQPCRQHVPTDRMLIFTKTEKIVCADFPGQPKSFRSQAKPFTSHALPLIVVITNAEVFLEVFPRVLYFALRLCRYHTLDTIRNLFSQGRVREQRCRCPLPSEPDVKVSLHPAQAVAKPRVSGAGGQDGLIPASWRWIPNFLKNARSSKYPCQSGSNGLASARILTCRRILVLVA